jgi:hypothetical protein
LRAGWNRLGFTLSPRGRHIGQGAGITASCSRSILSCYSASSIPAPEETRAALQRLQLHPTDTVASIRVGRHRIVFSTPDDFVTMHPGIDLDPGSGLPGIVALELAVDRCKRTADYCVGRQIRFAETEGRFPRQADRRSCENRIDGSPGRGSRCRR